LHEGSHALSIDDLEFKVRASVSFDLTAVTWLGCYSGVVVVTISAGTHEIIHG